MKQLEPTQMKISVSAMLEYLDDPSKSTPNDKIEPIAAGKSMLRQLLTGVLVVVQPDPPPAPEEEKPSGEVDAA